MFILMSKDSVANILGAQQVLGTGKYLGLPSMIGLLCVENKRGNL